MREDKKIKDYREYLQWQELSESTIQIYVRQAKLLLQYLGEKEVTKKVLLEYKKYLLSQNRKIASINLYIVAVNSYLKYAGLQECMCRKVK